MFNGVDVTFNVRAAKGFTFSGGTSTGKVENDWCDIRAAVPENASASASEPVLPTRVAVADVVRGLVDLHDPAHRRASQLGDPGQAERRHRPDRVACRQLHADGGGSGGGGGADRPSADGDRCVHGQPARAGRGVRADASGSGTSRRRRSSVSAASGLTAGVDIYNLTNNNVTLALQPDVRAERRRAGSTPTTYMNPRVFRLNAEFAF